MTCTVTLWDASLVAITTNRIDIEAFNPPARSIDVRSNGPLAAGIVPAGSHGAALAVAATDVYDVIVHTGSTGYAPPVLESFSGHGSPQLDVVLFSTSAATAAGGTGARPTTSAGVSVFIMGQPAWREEAKRAILTVVSTVSYLKRPGVSSFHASLRGDLEGMLRRLGINPDLIA
jgi:hypothetical protein